MKLITKIGILIVAGVVILALGVRLGLLVASVVPLVAMASLAIYAFGGGVFVEGAVGDPQVARIFHAESHAGDDGDFVPFD